MKKFITLFMVFAMLLCFVACGGNEADESTASEAGSEGAGAVDLEAKYGIDFDAEGEQKLSDSRAAKSVLVETKNVWLEGKLTFALDSNPKTYEDFVEHIGCDASLYSYSAEDGERSYIWVAEDDETAKLLAVFWETPNGWTLYSVGTTNLD